MPGLARSRQKISKILIVDDHPLVREGLAAMISRHGDLVVCGEAEDIPDALRQIEAEPPDLVIVDISLKQGNGIDLIKRIKDRAAAVRILVTSMYDESLYGERAVRAGAMGYLNKQEARGKIIEAIRQILAGKFFVSPALQQRLLRLARTEGHLQDSPVTSLSDRELEVFGLIGQGLSTIQIADMLHLSVKTVETHRRRIKGKLQLSTSTDLVRAATQWVLENG